MQVHADEGWNADGVAGVGSGVELLDLVWVAGLLEGEGSFLTQTGTRLPAIQCGMTDLDVLERLVSVLGGNLYPVSRQKEHHKSAWLYRVSGTPAADIMRKLRPYMGYRRSGQIDQALSVWDEWQLEKSKASEEREALCLKVFEYYSSMHVKSLRFAAEKFGVSPVTVRNYLRSKSLMK